MHVIKSSFVSPVRPVFRSAGKCEFLLRAEHDGKPFAYFDVLPDNPSESEREQLIQRTLLKFLKTV